MYYFVRIENFFYIYIYGWVYVRRGPNDKYALISFVHSHNIGHMRSILRQKLLWHFCKCVALLLYHMGEKKILLEKKQHDSSEKQHNFRIYVKVFFSLKVALLEKKQCSFYENNIT